MSSAAVASTDSFGNHIPQGIQVNAGTITIGPNSGAQVVIEEVNGAGIVEFPTHAAFEGNVANVSAGSVGSGLGEFIQMVISGASTTLADAKDFVGIIFNSANQGNTSDANMDSTGFNIVAMTVQGVEPGSKPGTPANWHSRTSGFASGVTSGRINYMYLPIGNGSGAVAVDWSFSWTAGNGPTDGTNILASGGATISQSQMQPLVDKYLTGFTDLERVETGSNNRTPAPHIGTGGSIFFQGIAAGSTQFTGQGIFFLNI